ncbi:hypothetical protein OAM76_03680 [Flavobacteriaceae bacterium]|nr:hypothetical protein [Flavobacteriaceae bacterium]MDC1459091.1 hypothetical protein [Flavobacteriaceae bacterium]
MASNEYLKYESRVYANLAITLADIGWTLKREYRHNGHSYDLALFYNEGVRVAAMVGNDGYGKIVASCATGEIDRTKDTLYTFIEIKYSNKKNFNRIKKSGELYVRKCLGNVFNYGILFINGKLFVVGKITSKQVKAFPDVSDYEWRKDISRPYLNQLAEDYNDDYDEGSVNVYSALFENEKLLERKIEKLEEELKKEKQEKIYYKKKLFDKIAYLRESSGDEELKLKLLDNFFLDYIVLSPNAELALENYNNNWCDNWNILESDSKKFIRESENLYKHILEDYTPYVQGFAKALENEILNKLFYNFLKYFNKNKINIDYKITDKANSGTIKIFRTFLKRGNLDSFLSLDKMRFIISAIFSETNDDLLVEFRPVYLNYFNEMRNIFSKEGNINKLKMIRNLGAHTKPIEKKIANDFYMTFKSTFNEIINNYKFSKN